MKKLFLLLLLFVTYSSIYGQNSKAIYQVIQNKNGKTTIVNTAADKLTYWLNLAKQGIIPFNKQVPMGNAIYKSSKISNNIAEFDNSPDIAIYSGNNSTQSENSIAIDPKNSARLLNSNNSTDWSSGSVNSVYGTSGLFSEDGAETWTGDEQATGGDNNGDPATSFNLNGRMYVGFIHANGGQGVAYSDNGQTWTSVLVANCSSNYGSLLDKNHMMVDNSPTSAYKGNVCVAWTDFGGAVSDNNICFSHSTDNGATYSTPKAISTAVNAGSHNQGVNVQTGKNGEVFATWAIYDDWNNKGYEEAIGFAKSTDGGTTWQPATRIITNIHGIRADEPTNHRVNSFPSMAVNNITNEIYIIWANYGIPGVNTGDWINVYMIKSNDLGTTWSTPIQVTNNTNTTGKYSYLPWITCDNSTGALAVVFYDNRNCSGNDVEAWVSISLDEGSTWDDFRVSDVSFTTKAITGLASGYMGDYLAIAAKDGIVYPVWSDDRDGIFKAYTSPIFINLRERPTNFTAEIVNQVNGQTNLNWLFSDTSSSFVKFYIYRDNILIDSTIYQEFTDFLPSFGEHKYQISALHSTGESSKSNASVFWGKALISVNPTQIYDSLQANQQKTYLLEVKNQGNVPLNFNLKTQLSKNIKAPTDYCTASGDGDEFIAGVIFGDINNTGTSADGYHDYTNLSTKIIAGETYNIEIINGNTYSSDDLGIWIDFNHDGDFDDANENVVCTFSDGAQGTYQISVPDNVQHGETRMRIRIKYSGDDCGSPCGTTTYGEVEDYTVNVQGWLTVANNITSVQPGSTIYIPVTLNSTDYAPGLYQANMSIFSNAANNDTLNVPISMLVLGQMPLSASPIAVPQNICSSQSSMLYANVAGGADTIIYSWTDNNGFSSDQPNVQVTPTQTTTYTLTVTDTITSVVKEITINVKTTIQAPTIPIGEDSISNTSKIFQYYTNGSPDAYSYEWKIEPANAGTIAGNIDTAYFNPNNRFTGTASIYVRAIHNCGQSDWSDAKVVTLYQGLSTANINNLSVDIFPNPATDKIFINLNSFKQTDLNIEIYNSLGQIVYQNYNNQMWAKNTIEIDISTLPAGIYVANIKGLAVNKSLSFIKQ